MQRAPIERDTRQKRAIRDVFEQAAGPLSADEVLANAKATIAGLGIATVYRSIRAFVDDGYLQPVDVPGRGSLYERADKDHHHHFLCTTCNGVFELEGCEAELKATLPRGFRAAGHEVTIYGTCAKCARGQRMARRPPAHKR